ncbi:hypothetical protein Trydic_g20468 [Trypoxylus dichotomus]
MVPVYQIYIYQEGRSDGEQVRRARNNNETPQPLSPHRARQKSIERTSSKQWMIVFVLGGNPVLRLQCNATTAKKIENMTRVLFGFMKKCVRSEREGKKARRETKHERSIS